MPPTRNEPQTRFELIDPSLETRGWQRATESALESELSAAQQLCAALETRLAEIELLPAALLRQAFYRKP